MKFSKPEWLDEFTFAKFLETMVFGAVAGFVIALFSLVFGTIVTNIRANTDNVIKVKSDIAFIKDDFVRMRREMARIENEYRAWRYEIRQEKMVEDAIDEAVDEIRGNE